MPASKVYFTDFRCRIGVSQLDKLRKLLEQSEFSQIDFDGKFVAIKLHFRRAGQPVVSARELCQGRRRLHQGTRR